MVSLALPLLFAVAATVSSTGTAPAMSLPLPQVFTYGNTEFYNNMQAIQTMLQGLDLTSIAYKTHVKIGTPTQIKGRGAWNAQLHGDEETMRQKAKMKEMKEDAIARMQKHKGTKKIMKRDLGDKMVVFLVDDVIEN